MTSCMLAFNTFCIGVKKNAGQEGGKKGQKSTNKICISECRPPCQGRGASRASSSQVKLPEQASTE